MIRDLILDLAFDLVGQGPAAHKRWLKARREFLPDNWDGRLPVIAAFGGCQWEDGKIVCSMVGVRHYESVDQRRPTVFAGGRQRLVDVLRQLDQIGVLSGFVGQNLHPMRVVRLWPLSRIDLAPSVINYKDPEALARLRKYKFLPRVQNKE